MILDSHCHAWERWPYEPPVPDFESRARVEQLLFEMDRNGVARAVVICAQIAHNPDNNAYVMAAAERHGDRLVPFADVDSRWSPSYHQPGAAERLEAACARWNLKGFTHYLKEDDDGSWLLSDDGRRLFEVARQRRLIASLATVPQQMPAIQQLAAAFPEVPILCHHLGLLGPRTGGIKGAAQMVLAAAAQPNVFIKVSGFGNVAAAHEEYPYPELRWIVRTLREFYGPERLLWGSDDPVSRRYMTYRQTLDVVRRHSGLPASEVGAILGSNLERLLDGRRA